MVQSQPRIVLRYFPLVGRAQPLRSALADAGLAFDDVQLSHEDFTQLRDDLAAAGPYRGLPTLSWGDEHVSEALAISSFLAQRLGQYSGLSEVEIARQQAICSNCYLEVLCRLGEVIWADALYPGADVGAGFVMMAGRALDKLAGVDRQLNGTRWLSGRERPGLSDFFARESVELCRYVLGPERDPLLARRMPRAYEHAQRVAALPSLAALEATRPTRFTMRPDEPAVLERLREIDPERIGLGATVTSAA